MNLRVGACCSLFWAFVGANASNAAGNLRRKEQQCQSIAEIACGTEGFETLCAAVNAAGLGGALSGGKFTVFAPTNDAFAELGQVRNVCLLRTMMRVTNC